MWSKLFELSARLIGRNKLRVATKCSRWTNLCKKKASVCWKSGTLPRDNQRQRWWSKCLTFSGNVLLRSMVILLQWSHSHCRISCKMHKSLMASRGLYLEALVGSIPHSTRYLLMLGVWPSGSWAICSSSFLARSSNLLWVATSCFMVFIHALIAWIWWLLGPSSSNTLKDDPTRMFSTCLVGFWGVELVPNRSWRWACWTGLAGGVGMNVAALVGSAGLWSRLDCNGERRLTWLLGKRLGVKVPGSSSGAPSAGTSSSCGNSWTSPGGCWVGLGGS